MNTDIDSKITDAEWEIMRVVWAQDKATSKDIRDVLQQKRDWKAATTKTFIGRLVKKGMLHTETEGNKYIYSANINEHEFVKSTLDETFANICNQDVGQIIVDFISKSTLSFQDIESLEKVLEMKKKDAVDVVPCSCVPGQCKCHNCSTRH
ncbi:CopY/TcrY family copper transport repressor [Litoribacterium kuwaitense]